MGGSEAGGRVAQTGDGELATDVIRCETGDRDVEPPASGFAPAGMRF